MKFYHGHIGSIDVALSFINTASQEPKHRRDFLLFVKIKKELNEIRDFIENEIKEMK